MQWAAQAVVAVLLVVQLSRVGWGAVRAALPTAPLFYLFLVVGHLLPSLVEVLVYRPIWRTGFRRTLGAALRKRVLNLDLADYSGEAFFGLWAVAEGVERGPAFRTIRDANILSSATSMTGTVVAVAAALGLGLLGGTSLRGEHLLLLAALPLAVQAVVLLILRRRIFALSLREAARIVSLHTGRVLATSTLTVAMWAVAAPDIPLRSWIALLALQMGIARIPLLPGKDLVFASAGVGLAGVFGVAQGVVGGLLLVQVVVTKGINVLLLMLPVGRPRPRAPEPSETAPS